MTVEAVRNRYASVVLTDRSSEGPFVEESLNLDFVSSRSAPDPSEFALLFLPAAGTAYRPLVLETEYTLPNFPGDINSPSAKVSLVVRRKSDLVGTLVALVLRGSPAQIWREGQESGLEGQLDTLTRRIQQALDDLERVPKFARTDGSGETAYLLPEAGGVVGFDPDGNLALIRPDDYTGERGPQGPQGPAGPAGATGPRGEQGPAGSDGADRESFHLEDHPSADVRVDLPGGSAPPWSSWTTIATLPAITAPQAGLNFVLAEIHAVSSSAHGGGDRIFYESRIVRRRGGQDFVLSDHLDYVRNADNFGTVFSSISQEADEELANVAESMEGDVYRLDVRGIQQTDPTTLSPPQPARYMLVMAPTSSHPGTHLDLVPLGGVRGETGAQGAPGHDGAVGPRGPEGPQGQPGPVGPAGSGTDVDAKRRLDALVEAFAAVGASESATPAAAPVAFPGPSASVALPYHLEPDKATLLRVEGYDAVVIYDDNILPFTPDEAHSDEALPSGRSETITLLRNGIASATVLRIGHGRHNPDGSAPVLLGRDDGTGASTLTLAFHRLSRATASAVGYDEIKTEIEGAPAGDEITQQAFQGAAHTTKYEGSDTPPNTFLPNAKEGSLCYRSSDEAIFVKGPATKGTLVDDRDVVSFRTGTDGAFRRGDSMGTPVGARNPDFFLGQVTSEAGTGEFAGQYLWRFWIKESDLTGDSPPFPPGELSQGGTRVANFLVAITQGATLPDNHTDRSLVFRDTSRDTDIGNPGSERYLCFAMENPETALQVQGVNTQYNLKFFADQRGDPVHIHPEESAATIPGSWAQASGIDFDKPAADPGADVDIVVRQKIAGRPGGMDVLFGQEVTPPTRWIGSAPGITTIIFDTAAWEPGPMGSGNVPASSYVLGFAPGSPVYRNISVDGVLFSLLPSQSAAAQQVRYHTQQVPATSGVSSSDDTKRIDVQDADGNWLFGTGSSTQERTLDKEALQNLAKSIPAVAELPTDPREGQEVNFLIPFTVDPGFAEIEAGTDATGTETGVYDAGTSGDFGTVDGKDPSPANMVRTAKIASYHNAPNSHSVLNNKTYIARRSNQTGTPVELMLVRGGVVTIKDLSAAAGLPHFYIAADLDGTAIREGERLGVNVRWRPAGETDNSKDFWEWDPITYKTGVHGYDGVRWQESTGVEALIDASVEDAALVANPTTVWSDTKLNRSVVTELPAVPKVGHIYFKSGTVAEKGMRSELLMTVSGFPLTVASGTTQLTGLTMALAPGISTKYPNFFAVNGTYFDRFLFDSGGHTALRLPDDVLGVYVEAESGGTRREGALLPRRFIGADDISGTGTLSPSEHFTRWDIVGFLRGKFVLLRSIFDWNGSGDETRRVRMAFYPTRNQSRPSYTTTDMLKFYLARV